jgi:hypothetical protein
MERVLRAMLHGPKLPHCKYSPRVSHPLLLEDYRATIANLNDQSDKEKKRR